MPRIHCPYCRVPLDVPAEQQGRVIACASCHATLSVPPMEQIQAPDMRLDPLAPIVPSANAIKDPATDLPAVTLPHTTWDDRVARSAAFRREMARYADDKLPDLRGFGMETLPGDLPDEADELGEPVGSLHLRADGRVSLIIGLLLLGLGASSIVAVLIASVVQLRRMRMHEGDGLVLVLALSNGVILCSGGVLAYRRLRAPARALWVCPQGLIWEYGTHVGFCRWAAVHDFALSAGIGRPMIWLSPARGIPFVLWGRQGPSIMPIADYIEMKTTAARLPVYLERLYDGERLEFGAVSMDRAGMYWRADHCKWADVASVHLDGSYFVVNHVRHRARFHLSSRQVSFPAVAQAIARIVTEDGLPARERR